MWTMGSTEFSVEEATHHSGLDGDYQLMVVMGVTNRSHLIGHFQLLG